MSTLHWVDGGYVLVNGEDYGPPYSVCGTCTSQQNWRMSPWAWRRLNQTLAEYGARRGVGEMSHSFARGSTVKSLDAVVKLCKALGFNTVKLYDDAADVNYGKPVRVIGGTSVWFSNK